jgi:hypothetical protein
MVRSEKRKNLRQPIQRHVWIDLGNGAPLIECALGNMSDTGAKLVLPGRRQLPSQFILCLAQDGRVARKCRIAWKEGDTIGVEFTARRLNEVAGPPPVPKP